MEESAASAVVDMEIRVVVVGEEEEDNWIWEGVMTTKALVTGLDVRRRRRSVEGLNFMMRAGVL